jgi:type I restriction enzyme M protein
LINAASFFEKMSRSLGNKRNQITVEQIEEITQVYGAFTEGPYCKIFDNEDFGYHRITVEQPQRKADGSIVTDRKGEPKPDSSLRDYENIPLKEDIEAYFNREVQPHVPDAWIDHSKTKVGYTINFTRYFYEYQPLRSTAEIRADIKALKQEMDGLTERAVH